MPPPMVVPPPSGTPASGGGSPYIISMLCEPSTTSITDGMMRDTFRSLLPHVTSSWLTNLPPVPVLIGAFGLLNTGLLLPAPPEVGPPPWLATPGPWLRPSPLSELEPHAALKHSIVTPPVSCSHRSMRI